MIKRSRAKDNVARINANPDANPKLPAVRANLQTQADPLRDRVDMLERQLAERTAELLESNRRLQEQVARGREKIEEGEWELEGRLHRLAANIPGFLYTFRMSADGRFSFPFTSDGIQDIYDLRPGDVETDMAPLHSQAHPDDRPRIEEAIARSARELSFFNVEFRILNPLKGERWIESRAMPQREPNGGVLWHGVMFDIGARKAAEVALRASEQRYREVFDNVSDLLFLLEVTPDSKFRFIEVNPAVEKLMDRSRNEIVGKHVEEVIRSADAHRVIASLRRCLEVDAIIDEEVELDLPGGNYAFQVASIPVRDMTGGRIGRVACVARNVTMSKQHEAVLQERSQLVSRLRRLVEVAPGVIGDFLLSPDGTVSMPTAAAQLEEIIGFRPEDVVNDASRVQQMIHPDDLPRHLTSIAESARTMQPWHDEFRLHHPRKGEIWIEGRSIPEREPDGGIRWYGFLHDVTERKHTEALLHASEQKFRTLAEHSPDVIGRYDRVGRRIYVNPQYEQVSGVSAAHCLGKTSLEYSFVPETVGAQFSQKLMEAMESGVAAEVDFNWIKDGKPIWWFVRIVPEFDTHGRVASALAIACDISERKAIEEVLRAFAVRRDTDREEERRRIARELHDELGQQLAALRMKVGALDLLFGKDQPRLREEMTHLLTLVDKTIQVTRDVSASLRPAVLDMGIIAALEWLTAEFSQYSGLACRLNVSEREVSLSEEMAVTIFRIAQESLTNAARHSKAERIEVTFNRKAEAITLEVKDDGVGFDTGGSRKSNSFGLLGIRERALAVGGEAVVSSKPGCGTVVEVRIPVGEGKGSSGDGSVGVLTSCLFAARLDRGDIGQFRERSTPGKEGR
jgi:PAS domain S-box-containing protein